jgi:YD repeat-containing protein
MRSFRHRISYRVVVPIGVLLLVGIVELWAQEYHKEVFLSFPGAKVVEQGFLYGPQAIGVDFDGNLTVFSGKTLSFYNDSGEKIRDLNLEYGHDLCFDEYGNIFVSKNNGGEVTIYKYDPSGNLLGTMTNGKEASSSRSMTKFLGRYINYLPGVGLFLHSQNWEYIPIKFVAGLDPDMTTGDKRQAGWIVDKGKLVVGNRNALRDGYIDLSIIQDDIPRESLSFTHIFGVEVIYSLDTEHQYYFVYMKDPEGEDLQRYIYKYKGDKLLFITEELPPNRIDYLRGKKIVADNRGTIYYYYGDQEKIQIIRWMLK